MKKRQAKKARKFTFQDTTDIISSLLFHQFIDEPQAFALMATATDEDLEYFQSELDLLDDVG